MFVKLKHKVIKIIEKIPLIQIFIYNNLNYFKFLFPHDKDYYALRLLFKNSETRAFVDIGGNIGLASLNLICEFSSLKEVIGIEAEKFNYNMLKLNYSHFTKLFRNIKFNPLYAMASFESGNSVKTNKSLLEL